MKKMEDLLQRLAEQGARVEPRRDALAVAGWGELATEVAALREGWGWVPLSWRGGLELAGPDRFRLLNGLVTCDVRELATGDGGYGYFTSLQGRVLADVAILSRSDRFWLDLPHGAVSAMEQHIGKYILADRVELRKASDAIAIRVVGPGAAEGLAGLVGVLPEGPWSSLRLADGGLAVRRGRPGPASYDLLEPGERWSSKLEAAGCRRVGFDALEVLRVEAGCGSWGVDFGHETFPQEIGEQEQTVDYEKGCYLGQEVVARIHFRGGVQRGLRRLWLGERPAEQLGRVVLAEGREAGRITSAIFAPHLRRGIGLAVLHSRAAEPGQVLEIEGGGRAEVAEPATGF